MNLDVRMPSAGSGTMALVVAVGMVFGADPDLAQTEPQAKPRALRVMTYNIKHGQTNAACTQPAPIAGAIDAAPEGPGILMGDFNARPTTAEMQPIYLRFLDSWLDAPAPTAENPSGFTSPARVSSNPTSRIDYVFVSSDVDVSLAYVPIDARTRLASDHYPVVSDVALPGSAVGIGRKQPTLPEPVEGEDAPEVEPEGGGSAAADVTGSLLPGQPLVDGAALGATSGSSPSARSRTRRPGQTRPPAAQEVVPRSPSSCTPRMACSGWVAPDTSLEAVKKATGAELIVAGDLKTMEA